MVKTIDKIIQFKYAINDNNFVKDFVEYMSECDKNNIGAFIGDELECFIKKITFGKKKSLLGYFDKDPNERIIILNLVAEKYSFTLGENLSNVLDCIEDNNITDFKWTHFLEFVTNEQRERLFKIGFSHDIQKFINKKIVTIDDVNTAIIYHKIAPFECVQTMKDNLDVLNCIKNHNIKINHETIRLMTQRFYKYDTITNMITKYAEYDVKILGLLNEEYNYLYTFKFSHIEEYLDNMFAHMKFENTDILAQFVSKYRDTNYRYLMKYIEKYQVRYTLKFINNMIYQTSIEQILFEDTHDDERDKTQARINYIIRILKNNYIDTTIMDSIFECICIKNDNEIFALFIHNYNEIVQRNISYKNFSVAIHKRSMKFIEYFLDSKFVPDISCFTDLCKSCRSMRYKNDFDEIFKLFVNYGFKININVIKTSIEYKCYIKDLKSYGYTLSDDLYDHFYETDSYCEQYTSQYQKNHIVHTYEKIRKNKCRNTKKIIDNIKNNIINTTNILYDLSVVAKNDELINLLESEHNFKPNTQTLTRIPKFDDRVAYLKRII